MDKPSAVYYLRTINKFLSSIHNGSFVFAKYRLLRKHFRCNEGVPAQPAPVSTFQTYMQLLYVIQIYMFVLLEIQDFYSKFASAFAYYNKL